MASCKNYAFGSTVTPPLPLHYTCRENTLALLSVTAAILQVHVQSTLLLTAHHDSEANACLKEHL